MASKYKDIVPWGRNFDEYKRMFDLTDSDLKLKILVAGRTSDYKFIYKLL